MEDRKCQIEGCTNRYYAKGFCARHYHLNRNNRLKQEIASEPQPKLQAVDHKEVAAAAEVIHPPERKSAPPQESGRRPIGIVREVDSLGRVVLPIELRELLGIEVGDGLEIYIDETTVILKKYAPGCLFCGSIDNNRFFKGKQICTSCL